MLLSSSSRTALLLGAIMLTVLPKASAQTFVGAAFQQAFTSTSTLESPRGFSVFVGADRILGPFGLSLSYRYVSEGSGVVAQTCGFAFCTPGPFDQSYSLQTVDLDISLPAVDNPSARFTLGANISMSSQAERLQHVDTGEVIRDSVGPDLGLGVSARLELPVAQHLHPFLSAQYDRLLANPCAADALCYGDRNVTRLAIGLIWRP